MAATQTELTDGVPSTHLKYEKYIEEIPGVDKHFLNRCYNAVDSIIFRKKGGRAQRRSRRTLLTFQKTLRKVARCVCLYPGEVKSADQQAEITRTRAFLGPGFFNIMGFYGIDITPSTGPWTFVETMTAEAMTAFLDDLLA